MRSEKKKSPSSVTELNYKGKKYESEKRRIRRERSG